MSRYVIELSYKGTAYRGWQVQKNTGNTIQRLVNEKLSTLLHEDVKVMASGRTDAGVHAKQNFIHFDVHSEIGATFLRSLNFILPEDVAAKNIFLSNDDFNTRFHAISRRYEYLISYKKNPFVAAFSSYYPYEPLSIQLLNEAADLFKSHKDFAAFSKRRTQVKTTLSAISHAQWSFDDSLQLLKFNITADRFLRGMVRGIVATSIRLARAKLTLENLEQMILSKQPHKTDFSAPAQGLTLLAVQYPEGVLKKIEF